MKIPIVADSDVDVLLGTRANPDDLDHDAKEKYSGQEIKDALVQ